jgi:hypothetical protein|uniref:Uncharacterized protein n=1 Tax=viral metagenome TaxID=1070528 RepID=A0A6C0BFE3_9ZZZZ
MEDIVSDILLISNIVTIFAIFPIIYYVYRMLTSGCSCAINWRFWCVIVYILITLGIVVGALMVNVSQKMIRIIIVIYFFITIAFAKISSDYLQDLNKNNCTCIDSDFNYMLLSQTVIRWVGVYCVGITLMVAGLILFLKSKTRPFSFPRS